MEWTTPTRTQTLEWRMRVTLKAGGMMVGGYVGTQDGHLYLADELSGEIHDLLYSAVDKFDVVKYSSVPTR